MPEVITVGNTDPSGVALGLNGSDYIADTDEYTGDWTTIMAIAASTVIASLTSSTMRGTLTSISLAEGAILYGQFSQVQLTSGAVVAYDRKPW